MANMQCYELEKILEQQPEGPLPDSAVAHIDDCEPCRSLLADLEAIRLAALELGAVEIAPPERIWISLRNQLEAEGLIRNPQPAPQNAMNGWWSVFQRPALAGAFLALLLVAAGLISFPGDLSQTSARQDVAARVGSSLVPSAQQVFNEEVLNVSDEAVPGFPRPDAAVTASFRRNLDLVNNLIVICEESVREQPDNDIAREYLYGAYEQKAELLATAMDRGTAGGLW
jgi:hypothetical protein